MRGVIGKLGRPLDQVELPGAGDGLQPTVSAQFAVYVPDVGPDRVDRDDEGFAVSGEVVENLVRKLVLDSRDAVEYLSDRLEKMGVLKELRKRGYASGDTVRIGEETFELEG